MIIVISFVSVTSQTRQSENLVQGSVEGTVDGLVNDPELQGMTILTGVISILSVVGITSLLKNTHDKSKKEEEIVLFMKHNHSILKRDFSLASGDIIRDIGYTLKLNESEANLLVENIEGSDEQRKILNSLSGKITVEKARSFAENLTKLVRDSVEPYRYVDLLEYALISSD